jgi:phospholipid/cholesterol/gamma-HCH transport system substrate-binding protein
VTYQGVTIGRVTKVEPTETGARATMSIEDRYRIPHGERAFGVGDR